MDNEQSDVKRAKPQYGLVGFFDILGYQSFLDANDGDPGEVTNTVLSTLVSLENEAGKRFKAMFPDSIKETIGELAKHEWLVFSDTILLTSTINLSELHEITNLRITLFLIQCASLTRHMFDFGLPIRGAVEIGNYFTRGTCFAGKPIVSAYRQANKLELAASVVSKEVVKLYEATNTDSKTPLETLVALNYSTPLKHGEELLNLVVPSPVPAEGQPGWKERDLKQLVLEVFWAHNKQLNASARVKASHTEEFLRYLKMDRTDFD